MLYFAFHVSALDGVPVMMPARRQCWVFCKAGAIWFVLSMPRPASAKPSCFPGVACARASPGLKRIKPPPRAIPTALADKPCRNLRREVDDESGFDCFTGAK